MTPEAFGDLSPEQQWAAVIAYRVRDTLESFVGGENGIPDSIMAELNRRLRLSVLESVYSLMNVDQPGCLSSISLAVVSIPDCWEIPELLAAEKTIRPEVNSDQSFDS
jgi:hypothetical protein